MAQVDVMPDDLEVVHYDEAGIPLYIRKGLLSSYVEMRAVCHWHEDFEFICVEKGAMRYSVNGRTVLLREGDSLFVNSRQMHFGFEYHREECSFICILVHPDLLAANTVLSSRFIRPLVEHGAPYLLFPAAEPNGSLLSDRLAAVWQCKEQRAFGYELEALSILMRVMTVLVAGLPEDEEQADEQIFAQRSMVTFIAKHFAEPLTLEEIAQSAHLSKSTCIRLFKRYAGQSPFDFLISYRLEFSRDLLCRTTKSVTEIAALSGFNNLSYFGKLFRRRFGCSPSAYRGTVQEGAGSEQ